MTTAAPAEVSEKIGIKLVRHYFAAYAAKDREELEALLTADFTFTSPLDDEISRAEYFARCWPNSEKMEAVHLEQVLAEGDEVFAIYRCDQSDGSTFRNTEQFKIDGQKIKSVNVYFGRELLFSHGTTPPRYSAQGRPGTARHPAVTAVSSI